MQIRHGGLSALWILPVLIVTLSTVSCSREDSMSSVAGTGPSLGGPVSGEIVAIVPLGQDVQALVQQNGLVQLGYLPDSRTLLFEAPNGFNPKAFAGFGPNDEFEYTESGNGYISFYEGDGSTQGTANQAALVGLDLGTVHQSATGVHSKVAVLDTGVDMNHPDLVGCLVRVDNTILGPPDLDGTVSPADEGYEHGTHVCSVIHQVAPGAEIYPFKVLGEDGRGTIFDLSAGVDAAIAYGVDIVNLSLSISSGTPMARKAMQRLFDAGIVVVAAGGNNTPGSAPVYPASDPNVHGVAATGGLTIDYTTISDFSAVHVTDLAFAAPGFRVEGAYPPEAYTGGLPDPAAGATGTSTACAVVTGAMALMFGEHDPLILNFPVALLEVNATVVSPENSVKFGLVSPADAIAMTVVPPFN